MYAFSALLRIGAITTVRISLRNYFFIPRSIQTIEDLYYNTFTALRRANPTFEALADVPEAEITGAIVIDGPSRQRSVKSNIF